MIRTRALVPLALAAALLGSPTVAPHPPATAHTITVQPAAQVVAAGKWTSYSGKGRGKLVVGRSWKALDVRSATPPRAGVETHLVYLNATPKWRAGKSIGVCRVMYRRDKHGKQPADPTGYTDFTIAKAALIGKAFLVTHVHEEVGQKGRNGRWYVRCGGGIKSISISTRYEKTSVVW